MLVQKLKKQVKDEFEIAEKYYAILSDINSLGLTPREIQLVAFTAIRGNITNANVRDEFCSRYKTTSPTINNIISKLKKMKVFVKDRNKIKVNPVILLDFTNNVVLEIKLNGKT